MIAWLKRMFARSPAKPKLEMLSHGYLGYGQYAIRLRNGPQTFLVSGALCAWYHQPEHLPCSSTFTRRMDDIWQRLEQQRLEEQ